MYLAIQKLEINADTISFNYSLSITNYLYRTWPLTESSFLK
ncbi:hypothetical protein [Okeania sp.]|nr:hypothetical protein [Okeania sp.]MEB3340765.1 hypothetical protein [Okeania sp.]